MINSVKHINLNGSITYFIYDGSQKIFEYTVNQGKDKRSIIEAYSNSHSEAEINSQEKLKKAVMKALGQVDEDLKVEYRHNYPWGGKRENAGRKKGSKNRKKRDNRTEKLRHSVTPEEKMFLIQALNYYRKEVELNPELKQKLDRRILEKQRVDN